MKLKKILVIFFLILCFAFPAHAYILSGPTDISSLTGASDIVAVGHLTKVTETDERTTLGDGNDKIDVIGAEAVFEIDEVFKGELNGDKAILHYYKCTKESDGMNGPFMLNLEMKGHVMMTDQETGKQYRTNEYLLFMKKTDDGRYMPTSGYLNSAFSLGAIEGIFTFGPTKREIGDASKGGRSLRGMYQSDLFPKR